MDAISGFKLLADSSDTAYFQHPRSPTFFQQEHQQHEHQEVPTNYHGNTHNMHLGLGHDVQVVSTPSTSYNLPPVQVPSITPQQQHSPKQQLQPQQASPRAMMQIHVQPEPIKQQAPQNPALTGHGNHHQIQPQQMHAPIVKGLINQEYEGEDDMGGDDEEEDPSAMNDEEEVRVRAIQAPLEPAMKNVLVCLIGEYLNEMITFRMFLSKIRQCLCSVDSPPNNKEVFSWILRCLLEGGIGTGGASGHVQRMAAFLEENGALKVEIESSSAVIKEADNNVMEFDIGEKRKRREKKSISRGLRSAPNKWCKAESQMLIRLVHENGDKSWKRIAEQLGGGKTGAQCAQHWKRVLSPQIRKGSWDDQEEELLLALVERYGQSWKNIAGEIKTRTDIQCRYQYQKSCLSRQCEWQPQEDALLGKKVAQVLHESSGSNNPSRMHTNNPPIMWVEVAKFIARAKLTKIPRTALECKQRWYAINGNAISPSPSNAPINNQHQHQQQQQHQHQHQHQQQHHHQQQQQQQQHHNSNNIPTHNSNNFHNINYSNINNNFTMVTQTF